MEMGAARESRRGDGIYFCGNPAERCRNLADDKTSDASVRIGYSVNCRVKFLV